MESIATAVRELQSLVSVVTHENLSISEDNRLQELGDRMLGLLEAFPRHSDTSHMKGHLSSIHATAVTLWNVAVAFRASGNVSICTTRLFVMLLFIDTEIICGTTAPCVAGTGVAVRATCATSVPL